MSTVINRDEWLEALGEAQRPALDPSALSISELATLLNLKRDQARRRGDQLIADGKAIEVSKIELMRNGHVRRVRAFKLVESKKKVK